MKLEDNLKCSSCSNREDSNFKCVGSGKLEFISQFKSHHNFKKKEIIFNENSDTEGFYCIKNGLVRVYKSSSSGKEQTFQISGSGKWLGFRDIISGNKYNHSAVCLEDTEVCFIPTKAIKDLIREDAEFQIEIMKYLADEWRTTEDNLLSMGTKQIHNRLAELLLTFQDAAGGSAELILNITREVMATCIGTKTETLIRSLADFKDRNWIELDKNKITIVNRKALVDLSEQIAN
jgi:CRP/FNR family transcriptional regulator